MHEVDSAARLALIETIIMARAPFGATWWGAQWLNALHAVDSENRLPRGRRYANNSSVKDLHVDGGRAEARVQGSRRSPYRVTLEVPPLPAEQTSELLDTIATSPGLIGRLLNRELDPALLDHAEAKGIHVFPRTWADVGMDCSCPDWALPCKHIAAVIDLLSREIDSDPFQVFRLRGVDLIAELDRRGLRIADQATATLPTLQDLLPDSENESSAAVNAADSAPSVRIDYSGLASLLDPLLQALPSDAGFTAAPTIRKAWQTQMRRVMRRATSTLETPAEAPEQAHPMLPADTDPVVIVDDEGGIAVEGADTPDFPAFLDSLASLDADRVIDQRQSVAGWYTVRTTALHLLACGAAVPRLLALPRQSTGGLWMPALLDPEVRHLLQSLAAALPSGLVRLHKGRRRYRLAPLAQACLACAVVMDQFIRDHAELPAAQAVDKLLGLLFGDGCDFFTAPGERGLPERVHIWLSRLQLAERAYLPVLTLDEPAADPPSDAPEEAFGLSVAVQPRDGVELTRPTPLADVLTEERLQHARAEVLQTVSLLAESWPPLHDYLRDGAVEPLNVPAETLPDLLFNAFPVMRLLGIRIQLPRALDRMLRPRASVAVEGQAQESSGLLAAADLFQFNWRIAVGDHLLSRDEFEALVADARGVVRFRGEYVFLDPDEIEHLRKHLEKPPTLSGTEVMRIALAEEYDGAPITLDDQAREHIRRLTETDDIPVPEGLDAELRPYQVRGFSWLYRNACLGFGSILADDMGLGKTVQVITTLLRLKEDGALAEGKAIVIVPTTLLTNWQRELARFAPSLSVTVHHGSDRTMDKDDNRADVLLTTYGTARRDAAKLKRRAWRVLVVDEAQNLKNPTAEQTRAVKALPSQAGIAMSGTPVENRLVEYWSVMDVVNRGYLGPRKRFEKDYGKPIQVHGDEQVAARFRRVTAPFLMRRLKSDTSIISDLPEKIVQDQFCELTAEQAALYESVVREAMQVIEGESDTFKRQGLVLQMILALKQICNHPGHYLKHAAPAVEDSGKGLRLLELLEAAHRQHEKVLVFTQFREMGDILCRWVQEAFGQAPDFLHGGVSRKRRDAMVQRFQDNPASRVLILSLKAGGTGLNLTAASQVIHYDLWWNPAVEDQATDRAYRIGQTRGVQVHRLITRHTFEERINDMINAKRGLAGLTVTAGEQWIGQLGDDALREIFSQGSG